MSRKTTIFCDIKDCNKEAKSYELAVKFLTEQNEGRVVGDPYVQLQDIDLCETHHFLYVEHCPIVATGAMGFNSYSINVKEDM